MVASLVALVADMAAVGTGRGMTMLESNTQGTVRSEIDAAVQAVHAKALASDNKVDHSEIRRLVDSTAPLLTTSQVEDVVERVDNLVFGMGPLEPLLGDPTVTEIMVNGPGRVWVERAGALERSEIEVDAAPLGVIIERIVAPLGLRVDRTSPFVDARLPDGSRVNVAVPPLALDGPYLTIRRFSASPFPLARFCEPDVERLLVASVQHKCSLIVSGGTGSGKTSLLNALGSAIADTERVVTIEDAAELQLPGSHVVRLESRPPNAEGVGGVSIRALVRNALRMRPDRIIVGEVRGAEALDMVQAMNTGHDGSMSTCHANSPGDALRRVQAMSMMSDLQLPAAIVRDHLLAALDLVVHVERSSSGVRRVVEIDGCDGETTFALVRRGRCEPRAHQWMAQLVEANTESFARTYS